MSVALSSIGLSEVLGERARAQGLFILRDLSELAEIQFGLKTLAMGVRRRFRTGMC